MIGVIANREDQDVVAEFFELFKTPWEFQRSERNYDVLLCGPTANFDGKSAKFTIIYGRQEGSRNLREKAQTSVNEDRSCFLIHNGDRFPVYRGCDTFEEGGSDFLIEQKSERPAVYFERHGEKTIAHVGYDLFGEIRTLLTSGQPAANGGIPTLELHIALLRDLITASGITVAEIPPIPVGHRFMVCLTHDVDHPLMRNHGFDHTTLGFLYRATIGTILGLLRGRRTWREAVRNLAAAAKLPLVHLGAAKDLWADFDRYRELEGEYRSSFFVIPFRGRAGRSATGSASKRRAAAYGAAEIASQIRRLTVAGCEVGTHGIDAWTDSALGRMELEEIRRIAVTTEAGVRMHWLYFDEHSPETLERAGAAYDSTVGYNQTVGYRAGTTQVYKPLTTTQLLELPLHIMDTAMFYPGYLHLTPKEAMRRVIEMADNAARFGGCITVNWHDRSIAPERCWDEFYRNMLNEFRRRGAWFGTAAETVGWFRRRRSAKFEETGVAAEPVCMHFPGPVEDGAPDMQLQLLHDKRRAPVVSA